jgi:hypothetical protein
MFTVNSSEQEVLRLLLTIHEAVEVNPLRIDVRVGENGMYMMWYALMVLLNFLLMVNS